MTNSGWFKSIPVADRLSAKTIKSDGCWNYTGQTDISGYGIIKFDGKSRKAHRVAWALANGQIPTGAIVCHRCDNPKCVRVDHLFLGNHQANRDDCVAKKRQAVGERINASKLIASEVVEARKLRSSGRSVNSLARQFGVTHRAMKLIIKRMTWKHI